MIINPIILGSIKGSDIIAIVANASQRATTSTLTISKPTGTQTGDLMVCVIVSQTSANNFGGTWTGDTGWTEVVDSDGIRIAYKTAGAGEGSSYTFTPSGVQYSYGAIITLRNAVWDTVGTPSENNNTPAITVGANNSYLFATFAVADSNATFTNPSSGLVSYLSSNSDRPSIGLYYDDSVSSGSSGTKTVTITGGNTRVSVLFSVKPA